MLNTGFSWVRIDKGNIHCNFRYLDSDQVETIITYLKSYYEYRNITATVIDLGANGMLQESGDHYRPSGADPEKDYYFLVELYRKGTIVPQGCVEIIKSAMNGMAMHEIIPNSVFINKLKSNIISVDDVVELTASSKISGANDVTWRSGDSEVLSIVADGMSCTVTGESPGSTYVEAAVTVPEEAPISLKTISAPSAYWVGNIYKYIGPTKSFDPVTDRKEIEKYGINGFTQNSYYECVYDNSAPKKYKWQAAEYDGNPVMVTYKDTYDMIVQTFVHIRERLAGLQRLCLHNTIQLHADTPSTGMVVIWSSSSENIVYSLDDPTDSTVCTITAEHVGNASITARITDATGTFEDTIPLNVFAIDVTPSEIKLVTGAEKLVRVLKSDILVKTWTGEQPLAVEWATSNDAIASVEAVTPADPTTTFAEARIASTMGVGRAVITAIVEDYLDDVSYSDTVVVTVGNAAIDVPASTTINLLDQDHTLTITCALGAGFEVENTSDWVSGNPDVVEITNVTGTHNNTAVITGLAVGTSIITVTAKNGNASDYDRILITVVEAPVVTSGEMHNFVHGMYNEHGVIDWNHPAGESDTYETDKQVDTASEDEVKEFVDDLYDNADADS